MRKIGVLLLCIVCLTLTACTSSIYKNPDIPSEYTISSGDTVWEVNMDREVKGIFDGGGTREEMDDIIHYAYDEKEIWTLDADNGEVIYYLSTKKQGDKTSRDIYVGDSLNKLLDAYNSEELLLQETWENYRMKKDKYDAVYKFVSDDDRQIIYSLKDNVVVMIQVAAKQNSSNTSLEWQFIN